MNKGTLGIHIVGDLMGIYGGTGIAVGGCVGSLGVACGASVLGGGTLIYLSNQSYLNHLDAFYQPYGELRAGTNVLKSFDPATYPGEYNPAKDVTVGLGMAAAEAVAAKLALKATSVVVNKADNWWSTPVVPSGTGKVLGGVETPSQVPKGTPTVGTHPSGLETPPINPNLQYHLSNVDKFTQKGGVSGGHNADNFWAAAEKYNLVILKQENRGNGITHVEYGVQKVTSAGEPIFKPNGEPDLKGKDPLQKTIYDPKVFSDQQMYDMGVQAARLGHNAAMASEEGAVN